MKLGMAAWGLRETPLEEQLRMVTRLGLSALELSIAGHENDRLQVGASAEEIHTVKRLFADSGVSLDTAATGNDFTSADPAACAADLEKTRKVIAIAGQLGIKQLRIFAGFSPAAEVTGERWKTMIACLREASQAAQQAGVRVAVETHGGVEPVTGGVRHFFSTSSRRDLLLRLLAELPAEIGLVFDPANLGAVGMSTDAILDLYDKVKERVVYLHLKDFRHVSANALQPCACGEGQLCWGELAKAFAGFSGTGFMEYELPADIEAGTRRSLEALKAAEHGYAGTRSSAVDLAL